MLRRSIRFLRFLLLLYVALCVFLYLQQRRLIYQPSATRPVAQTPDFTLQRETGITLRGWVVHPQQARALLYFGGNGERIEDLREDFDHWFPDRAVYLLPYRGYASSDGAPSEQALIDDALALYDEVAAGHHGIAVIGRSLGSGVAVQLAARRPVERLALVTPFDSLAAVAQTYYPFVSVAWLLQDRYESWRYAASVHCPVSILAAAQDEVVPPANTRHLAESFQPAPPLLTIANAGHNTLQDDPQYQRTLVDFLR